MGQAKVALRVQRPPVAGMVLHALRHEPRFGVSVHWSGARGVSHRAPEVSQAGGMSGAGKEISERTYKPGSVLAGHLWWPASDGHLSRSAIAWRLQQRTRESIAARTTPALCLPCSGWGLPSQASHLACWWALTSPFHPYLFRVLTRAAIGGLLSAALSLASRPVGVTDHPVLWSPDFPLAAPKRDQRPSSSLRDFLSRFCRLW